MKTLSIYNKIKSILMISISIGKKRYPFLFEIKCLLFTLLLLAIEIIYNSNMNRCTFFFVDALVLFIYVLSEILSMALEIKNVVVFLLKKILSFY